MKGRSKDGTRENRTKKKEKRGEITMGIPIKPITSKTINRFPALYKIQAQKAIEYEVSDAIRITADSFVAASILALVEEFGFGTSEKSTKIHRFVKRLQSIIDVNADFYDDAVAIGLRNKLRGYGVDYGGENNESEGANDEQAD
jgi:hypothetical protein